MSLRFVFVAKFDHCFICSDPTSIFLSHFFSAKGMGISTARFTFEACSVFGSFSIDCNLHIYFLFLIRLAVRTRAERSKT